MRRCRRIDQELRHAAATRARARAARSRWSRSRARDHVATDCRLSGSARSMAGQQTAARKRRGRNGGGAAVQRMHTPRQGHVSPAPGKLLGSRSGNPHRSSGQGRRRRAAPQHAAARSPCIARSRRAAQERGYGFSPAMLPEVRPEGATRAPHRRLHGQAPCAGRLPVFVGDDHDRRAWLRASSAGAGPSRSGPPAGPLPPSDVNRPWSAWLLAPVGPTVRSPSTTPALRKAHLP